MGPLPACCPHSYIPNIVPVGMDTSMLRLPSKGSKTTANRPVELPLAIGSSSSSDATTATEGSASRAAFRMSFCRDTLSFDSFSNYDFNDSTMPVSHTLKWSYEGVLCMGYSMFIATEIRGTTRCTLRSGISVRSY